MATGYEAIVRLEPVEVAPEREDALLTLIGQNLPDRARVSTQRDASGLLLISVALDVVAADTSEVQLEAKDVVQRAVDRAGLSEQAALLDDIDVRTSS
jgi:hypothetical protein